MQRIITGLLIVPFLACFVGVMGCGKEEKPKPAPGGGKIVATDGGGGGGAGPKTTIKPGKGKVTGRVVYKGDLPAVASLEGVMQAHNDKACCLAGEDSEKKDQTWFINADRGVANAVIWLNPPANAAFEVVNATGDAVIDQPHCVYVPHVQVVKPGQKLLIKNSAVVNHNTKLDVDTLVNRSFAKTIPPNDSAVAELNPQDKAVNVGCDFHGWMKAKVWVMPHQYVAVTKADGTFEIDNVPEGVALSVVAWHEGAGPTGYFNGGKKGKEETFKAGDNKLPDLEVSAK